MTRTNPHQVRRTSRDGNFKDEARAGLNGRHAEGEPSFFLRGLNVQCAAVRRRDLLGDIKFQANPLSIVDWALQKGLEQTLRKPPAGISSQAFATASRSSP